MRFVSTVRFAVASALLPLFWVNQAAADLYRWVDPETGSVKFSSYPPPWYGNEATQRRAPKVEVILPGKAAPAFGAVPDVDREAARRPVESAKENVAANDTPIVERRGVLLKLLAQRTAALISSPPETMGKPYLELADTVQELEKLDRQLRPADRKDEAARLEEKRQFAAPLESRRAALVEQISSLSPPALGTPPDKMEGAWLNTQRLLAALGWMDSAITSIDPRNSNARHFEMTALIDKVFAQWEPYVDPSVLRKNRVR